MIMEDAVKIVDDLVLDYEGHERCMCVNLVYDGFFASSNPYHLFIELFSDFVMEEWYETKEEVIGVLKELDERFDYCGILDGSLEAIEDFKEPSKEHSEIGT